MVYTAAPNRSITLPALPVIPFRAIAPWLAFAAFMLLALYFVAADQGATSLVRARWCTSSCTMRATSSASPATRAGLPT